MKTPCTTPRLWFALLLLALPALGVAAQGRRPFGLGETLVYDVKYGFLNVGVGRMDVVGLEEVRGRPAWHVKLEIEGGIPGFRARYVLESWMDTLSLNSLRFESQSDEGGRRRRDSVEIYPERGTYSGVSRVYNGDARRWDETPTGEQPASPDPLDQAAFLFFARTLPLEPGNKHVFPRYFRPDRNPVTLTVLRRDTARVAAGVFPSIVVQPLFQSRGILGQGSRAEVWFTHDDRRLMVRMETALPFGSVVLQLKEFQAGVR